MELNSAILPLCAGARAMIKLTKDRGAAILCLTSNGGEKLQLGSRLSPIKGGYPPNARVTGVRSWENQGAEEACEFHDLLYWFSLEIEFGEPDDGYPYHEKIYFEVTAKDWQKFFQPSTFAVSD